MRWGIAGRNRAKLENLRNALNDGSTDFKVENAENPHTASSRIENARDLPET